MFRKRRLEFYVRVLVEVVEEGDGRNLRDAVIDLIYQHAGVVSVDDGGLPIEEAYR